MRKPVLFLDFDRTLFDTTKLYEWLGAESGARLEALTKGEIEDPNFAPMLYADTRPFLEEAQRTHRLVLLTYTTTAAFQERKVYGSGIAPYFTHIIMTNGAGGGSGKGAGAKEYLEREGLLGRPVFVDDTPENISEMKTMNPEMRCIRIDRAPRREEAPHVGLLLPDNVVATLPELLAIL